MTIVLMGAAGAGKTTVGRALASALGWTFLDADDLHSPANVAKMHSGQPLTDADRGPWLDRVHEAIAESAAAGRSLVVACSALREPYRRVITGDVPGVVFVFLDASRELLHARVAHRPGHFMPERLVDSQFATLEPPSDAIRIDAADPVDAQVGAIRRRLRL